MQQQTPSKGGMQMPSKGGMQSRVPQPMQIDRRIQGGPDAEARAKIAKSICPCCVTGGGAYIYCGVPTRHDYILPWCLHMVLCPQQRCDPQCVGGSPASMQSHCWASIPVAWLFTFCAMQSTDHWQTEENRRGFSCWVWE